MNTIPTQPPYTPPHEEQPSHTPSYMGDTPQIQHHPPIPTQGTAYDSAPITPSRKRYARPVAIAVAALFLMSMLFLMKGEGEKFMLVGVQFIPLAILGALAYGGIKNSVAGVFSYIWLAMLAAGVLFNAFANVLLLFMNTSVVSSATSGTVLMPGTLTLTDLFKPGAGPVLLWTILLLTLATMLSAAMLLRPIRVLMSRIMPIDPDNFVHKIGLCILTLILFTSFVPLIVLGGRPPILELLKGNTLQGMSDAISVRPIDLIYQFIWTIPATFIVAGWPIARTFRAMLVRLGMVRPSIRQALFATSAGLALAVISAFALDPAIHWIWTSMGWPTTDVQVFGKLLTQLVTPIGAVLIGVTAGVGEEMAVRGLMQPRIGLIASNLVFTAFHAFQYGVDGLLSVFIIGLILGIIRARSNTATSAIVHGMYDFTLIMTSVISGQ